METPMQTTLTSKGQVTIPKAVREALALCPGDRLDFVLEADGTVRVLPVRGSVKDLKGMLPKPQRPVTLDEMDETIRDRAGR